MPWAKPVIRETIKKYLRVRRAHEELERCNVEVRRIFTSIHDEDNRFNHILTNLIDQGSNILGPVTEYCTCRRCVNSLLLGHVRQIFNLDGFTGNQTVGCRKGCHAAATNSLGGGVYHLQALDVDNLKDDDGEEIDEGEANQVDGLLDFVTNFVTKL